VWTGRWWLCWWWRSRVYESVFSLGLPNATEEQQVYSVVWDMPSAWMAVPPFPNADRNLFSLPRLVAPRGWALSTVMCSPQVFAGSVSETRRHHCSPSVTHLVLTMQVGLETGLQLAVAPAMALLYIAVTAVGRVLERRRKGRSLGSTSSPLRQGLLGDAIGYAGACDQSRPHPAVQL
jgi:hypothetical protein